MARLVALWTRVSSATGCVARGPALALSLALTACGARSALPIGGALAGDAGTGGRPVLPQHGARTLSASWQHTCAVTSAGKVACWGQTVATPAVPSPTLVEGLEDIVEVAAGQIIDCARRADGTAWCWGMATGGAPQEVQGAVFSSIVAGAGTVCGIEPGGGVRCAGGSFLAGPMCNSGVTQWTPVTVPVPSLADVAGIAMGEWQACAFDHTGATSCWGCSDGDPQSPWNLGSKSPSTATPIPVPGVTAATRIAGETSTTCAVQADGTTTCWGDRSQFGPGIVNQPTGPATAAFPPSPIDLDVGVTFSCAGYADEIQCLGGIFTFADGCQDRVDTPLTIPLPGLQELSVGYQHACARDVEGRVWCWGCNTAGEVGDGTTTARGAPVPVL